jgi:hypothetical protein
MPRSALYPALARVNEEQIGVLRVSSDIAPVALYDGAAYDWFQRALRSISIDEAFARYLQRQRTGETTHADGDRMQMVYGELDWPIQPPPALRNARNVRDRHDGCAYEVQRRAMVWSGRRFTRDRATIGWRCALTARLRQALMDVGDPGDTVQSLPMLHGQVVIRMNDVLASGATVRAQAVSKLLEHLPVHKRTNLHLQITADPQELFERRRRMSLLRFRLADVPLDSERVATVRQACADLGFRILLVDENRLPDQAMLEGIRSEGFCDITLLLGMVCERTRMSRTLRYEQRIDSKATHTSALDIRMALWGVSDAAATMIARLHMDLHQLLHQRLSYLRTE